MPRRTLILLFVPLAALADDPFACVDPEFADAFLGLWTGGSPQYSTELPADAPELPLPASLELAGSMTSNGSITIAYYSEADAETVLSQGTESLRAGGWQEVGIGDYMRGFRTGATPLMATLCHPAQSATVSMQSSAQNGRTLLTALVYPDRGQMACGESAGIENRFEPPLMRYVPNLLVPADAEASDMGSGGGGDEYGTHVVLATTLDREALLRHFDDQIRAQGWTPDSAWSGGMTAGTVWTRSGPGDSPLVGTMRLAQAAEGVFNARFTVMSVAPETHHGGNFSTSTSTWAIGGAGNGATPGAAEASN